MNVTIAPVTADNFDAVVDLRVADNQRDLVASNIRSLAQANVFPGAEPFAILADDEVVGFTMLYSDPNDPHPASLTIVRFMIDHRHQRRGFGSAALKVIIDVARSRPDIDTLQLSVIPENDAAIGLYESFGFAATGEIAGEEAVYRLSLD